MPMSPSPIAKSGRFHLCATKLYMLKGIQERGAELFLLDWDGTNEEAIQAVYDDPREVFALDCDNYDERGYCLGHRRSE